MPRITRKIIMLYLLGYGLIFLFLFLDTNVAVNTTLDQSIDYMDESGGKYDGFVLFFTSGVVKYTILALGVLIPLLLTVQLFVFRKRG